MGLLTIGFGPKETDAAIGRVRYNDGNRSLEGGVDR